jgi:hypothetical protein
MFERLTERAERAAARYREAKIGEIAGALKAELPPGSGCEATPAGIAVFGRGLRWRYLTDAGLRGLLGRRG